MKLRLPVLMVSLSVPLADSGQGWIPIIDAKFAAADAQALAMGANFIATADDRSAADFTEDTADLILNTVFYF